MHEGRRPECINRGPFVDNYCIKHESRLVIKPGLSGGAMERCGRCGGAVKGAVVISSLFLDKIF